MQGFFTLHLFFLFIICMFATNLKNMQRVYNILVTLLGESKQGSYSKDITQYQFNCPYCADEKGDIDGKYNLEISFALGKFHCWSCNNAGPISKLIKNKGGKALYDEYFSLIKEIRESKYFNLDLFKDNGEMLGENYLKLPTTFRKIEISKCKDKALIKFLNERKITQDIIDNYNIGRTTWDEEDWSWRNRIVFPSYNINGDINYYVGRTYKETDTRNKYKNCESDKFQIIYHEDKIQWDADIYLVEGVIDCIYANNTISLLGKVLNKKSELYSRLYEKANANIIIVLDGDTTDNEIKRIYRLLDRGRLRGKIHYIRLGTDELPWKDFGEVYEYGGREAIIKCMKNIKTYTEIDLLI